MTNYNKQYILHIVIESVTMVTKCFILILILKNASFEFEFFLILFLKNVYRLCSPMMFDHVNQST